MRTLIEKQKPFFIKVIPYTVVYVYEVTYKSLVTLIIESK